MFHDVTSGYADERAIAYSILLAALLYRTLLMFNGWDTLPSYFCHWGEVCGCWKAECVTILLLTMRNDRYSPCTYTPTCVAAGKAAYEMYQVATGSKQSSAKSTEAQGVLMSFFKKCLGGDSSDTGTASAGAMGVNAGGEMPIFWHVWHGMLHMLPDLHIMRLSLS